MSREFFQWIATFAHPVTKNMHLVSVQAPDEESAVETAQDQFKDFCHQAKQNYDEWAMESIEELLPDGEEEKGE
jgi:1,2-phenylacetyl-CoA epoxidase PaaB subunit